MCTVKRRYINFLLDLNIKHLLYLAFVVGQMLSAIYFQIDILKQHRTNVSELMDETECFDDKDIGEDRYQRLQENSNELDNLTVTIVTTSNVITKSCKLNMSCCAM